jgi:hypothetical protein
MTIRYDHGGAPATPRRLGGARPDLGAFGEVAHASGITAHATR